MAKRETRAKRQSNASSNSTREKREDRNEPQRNLLYAEENTGVITRFGRIQKQSRIGKESQLSIGDKHCDSSSIKVSNVKCVKSSEKNRRKKSSLASSEKRPIEETPKKKRGNNLVNEPQSVSSNLKSGLKSKSKSKCVNLFQAAVEALHSSAVPQTLPCRENEFFTIYNFVKSRLLEESGGCMYISGVPGTGKTATVYDVIKNLKSESKKNVIPEFQFIEINGLRLLDPYSSYVQIYNEITGKKTSSHNASNLLDKIFTDPLKHDDMKPIVLLVDELDLLCTRKQTILYHLFEWPNKPLSRLILISIANAMDLPERVMMNRVASRLGLSRLTFQPYTHSELREILMSRLEGLDVFDCDGVQLISRKVAAISGDARRALDICRRAAEIAQGEQMENEEELVTMKHVDKALQEIFASPKLLAIRNASIQEQIFLRSIIQDFRLTGLEEGSFIDIYRHHCSICKFESHYTPSTTELLEIAYNLYDLRLILIDNNRVDILKRIRLNVSVDDILFSLKCEQ
ncbi:origin recognition complex subunit 1-like protein [Dinothrombium tinctorium]|uniref:Cell division control protein n=1 Tax=Dinothrombium tinctorium TaxID=1965070 RepID=A0A443QVA2_9ACAR|nr:origin recognition complex subunit 1-like protein [Dinothrombium tinctorium]RWS06978.1 origin recognition complex subunit 1-like protein [Dinothrombium tinctorium]